MLPKLVFDLSDVQPRGTGSVLTLAAGTGDGVAAGWRGALIDAEGEPIAGGELVVENAGPERATASCALPPVQVRDVRVKLRAPG